MADSRTQHTYQELRRRLLDGEFAPGTRLEFKRLADEIGVSTTPVREAVSQLASEGLLQLVPRLGAVVPKLSREETIELYGVREAMESYAAIKAGKSISPAQLADLDRFRLRMEEIVVRFEAGRKPVLDGNPLRDFLAADLAFHMTIIEAAANRRLTKLAADSHAHARIFAAQRQAHDRPMLDEAVRQHRSIFEAIARRDGDEARRQVALHIHCSLAHSLASQTQQPSPDRWWRAN